LIFILLVGLKRDDGTFVGILETLFLFSLQTFLTEAAKPTEPEKSKL
jgi:hypothetical protein